MTTENEFSKVHTFHRAADEDRVAQWETDVWCSDGSVVIGFGLTDEESKGAAFGRAREREMFLVSDPWDRLDALLAKVPGAEYLCATDITHAIKAIAEILRNR